MSGKIQIARRKCRSKQAVRRVFVLLRDLDKILLEILIGGGRRSSIALHRIYIVNFPGFTASQRQWQRQHVHHCPGPGKWREALHRNRRAMPGLKNQATARLIPADVIVRFSRGIREPGGRLFGDRGPHIESKVDGAGRASEVGDANRLRHRPLLGRHKQFGRKPQSIHGGFSRHPMGMPAVCDLVSARIGEEDSSVQKNFARQKKTGTPGNFRNPAAPERRKRNRGDAGH
jgi:hypothetical protein